LVYSSNVLALPAPLSEELEEEFSTVVTVVLLPSASVISVVVFVVCAETVFGKKGETLWNILLLGQEKSQGDLSPTLSGISQELS